MIDEDKVKDRKARIRKLEGQLDALQLLLADEDVAHLIPNQIRKLQIDYKELTGREYTRLGWGDYNNGE